MKGLATGHLDGVEGQERDTSAQINKMRRQHVQNYRKGFGGFCPWCGIVIREGAIHAEGCSKATQQDGKRRLLITDWETTTLIVNVNGKQYETETTGWTQRTVRNEIMWTKRVAPDALALLHHIEAMQAGIVYEKQRDPTESIPSVYSVTPSSYEKTPTPSRSAQAPRRSSAANLNRWSIAQQLSEEAERLMSSSFADRLRRQHVARYTNSLEAL